VSTPDIALILAAGAAERFGRPKQLARFEGDTLVVRAVRCAEEAGLEPIVVLGAHREVVEDALHDRVRRVEHHGWREGMGSSIAAGTYGALAGERTPGAVLVMTCDQPLVEPIDLRALLEACHRPGVEAAAALYEGVRGVPACFGPPCFDELCELGGDRGARDILRGERYRIAEVEIPAAARDIDTLAELEALGGASTAPNRDTPCFPTDERGR
jgi:molybdenum cofactor cytidylyltransferase